jgi:hypothetical protein
LIAIRETGDDGVPQVFKEATGLMGGYIDNYGSPGNPVIDITGTPLVILLNFAPKGGSGPQDFSVLQFAAVLGLPQALLAQLQTPLSQTGDQIWSQNTDANGKTMRDRASAAITSNIASAVSAQGSGFSAYNISASLPATGTLRSIVLTGALSSPDLSQIIFLSYELIGVSASFTSTTPYTGGLIPDPSYSVTFDVELLIQIGIPSSPGQFTLTAGVNIENADISASNWVAGLGDAVATVLQILSGQPGSLFQAAEGQINSSGGGVNVDLGPFSAILTQLSSAWLTALPFGFMQLAAFIDPGARTLNIRLTHPADPAPLPVNAAVPAYSLFNPLLGTSTSCVEPGGSLTVTGTYFPVAQANALYIGWTDTTSGTVSESDITWGPSGSPMPPPVTKPRNGNDGGNSLAFTNLVPNTTYLFAVRDQDQLTETPFTQPPVAIATQTTDIVDLLLEYGATQWPVGTAQLTATGSFAAPAQMPDNLMPGTYTLAAVLNGAQLASTTIEIEAACQTHVEVINPVSNTVLTAVEETYSFTLRGGGFEAGTVNVYIDSPSGTSLGAASISSGTEFQAAFIWPQGVTGTHSIVAQETVGGQTLSATTSVLAEALPS